MSPSRGIRSILVATDLTGRTSDLLRSAAAIAAATGADLHVVHAWEEPPIGSGEPRDVLSTQRRLHEKRVELHEKLGEAIGPSSVRNVRVALGPPAEAILLEAEEAGADLIVLGRHRMRGAADRYLGSTAERVLRGAKALCLVVNAPLSLPVRQVLVPSDLSNTASRALRAALFWVDSLKSDVHVRLTHVSGGEDEAGARREMENSLEAIVGDRLGSQMSVHILRGEEPADDLVRHAEAVGADMVVLGTRGESVLMRALLGSVSSAMVRQSVLPLVLVPPGWLEPEGAGTPGVDDPLIDYPVPQ